MRRLNSNVLSNETLDIYMTVKLMTIFVIFFLVSFYTSFHATVHLVFILVAINMRSLLRPDV